MYRKKKNKEKSKQQITAITTKAVSKYCVSALKVMDYGQLLSVAKISVQFGNASIFLSG